jgi:uncharacterized membrane protein YfcA
VLRHREHVDTKLLFGRILPWMAPGLVVGFVVFTRAPLEWFAPGLGLFVVAVAGLDLFRIVARHGVPARPLGPIRFAGTSFGAGIMQGIAGTGGPVLVYALGREGLCKARFRATLALVWLLLNLVLVTSYVATGRLGASTLPFIAGLVPVLVCAIALGSRLHHALDERRFKQLVLVMLVAAGVALLV